MNPYILIGSRLGLPDAESLLKRLTEWHDAMVAHERRQRTGDRRDECDDECVHAQARELWSEALTTFGRDARELVFLHASATKSRRTA